MSKWLDTTEVFPNANAGDWRNWLRPGYLHIEYNGGEVALQRMSSADAWETFQTLTAADDPVMTIELANSPAFRIVPSGGAKYKFIGG